jgi:hypothetical protein
MLGLRVNPALGRLKAQITSTKTPVLASSTQANGQWSLPYEPTYLRRIEPAEVNQVIIPQPTLHRAKK